MNGPERIPKSCKWNPQKNMYECKEKKNIMTFRDASGFPISSKSIELKEEKIDEMINITKECVKIGDCTKKIDLLIFELDTCPSCAAHKPIITSIVNKLDVAGIPISLESKPAREFIDDFSKAKCTGTPCVVSKKNGSKLKKVYDGNVGEVSAMSQILGLPNPLFKDLTRSIPKSLM